jgi:hypothetical protein
MTDEAIKTISGDVCAVLIVAIIAVCVLIYTHKRRDDE